MIPVMSEQTPSRDGELVASARGGDARAREELGHRVGRSAFVFAMQLTRDHEAALDVAQDSVLKFFKNLDRFDASRPIEPWLYQITRNRARDLSRRERLRRHESLDDWIEQGRPEHPGDSANAAAEVERAELRSRIWEAVSLMSDHHREVFVLRDFNGLSYREIAEVLSIPQGTVMSRLHAARTKLRALLSDETDDRRAHDVNPDQERRQQ